jgi:hypothetical protein
MPVPPYVPRPNPEDENDAQTGEYVEEVHELPPTVADELPPAGEPASEATEPTEATGPEILLPTEAQYETNGGPLGCCMGVVVGILLCILCGVIGFGRVTANIIVFLVHVDPATNIRIATAFFTLVGAVLGGYVGWKVGKRLYREYDPPVLKDRRRKAKAQPKEIKL